MADLHVTARLDRRRLDVSFDVADGEVLAVLGPNGAGKSTVAAIIAGLLQADAAEVRLGDRTLTDTSRRVSVPVSERQVGLLAQDPLLFPHLSVLGNVAFAARRPAGRRARAAALRWLESLGANDLADCRPAQLSGGQAQRVALVRALAAEPEVLVLDEPLSRLDVAAGSEVRSVLRQVLDDAHRGPTVLITHDLADVVQLADRVLVLEHGTVAETGRAVEVLAAPRSAFGARFAGLNVIRGVLREATVLRAGGGRDWHGVAAEPLHTGGDAVAVFSPAAVAVYRQRPDGSPRNVVQGLIASLEATGTAFRIRLADDPGTSPGLAADVTAEAVADLRLTVGEQVWFSVKTQAVALYPGTRTPPTPTLASRQ